ncbi:hypothetical protein EDB83DRAFT_1544756 [Lactarius deliciosus]|nr:hypothetical protein EDB83DRAFT_1544756 [Lactarius deliciosus]
MSLSLFFLDAIGSLPVRGRTISHCAIGSGLATARAHSLSSPHGRFLIPRSCASACALLLYAIGSDFQHCPYVGISLFFLYAIGSGFAFARARENSIWASLFGYRPCVVTLYHPSSTLLGSAMPLPMRGRIVMCALSGRCCHCPCALSALWLVRGVTSSSVSSTAYASTSGVSCPSCIF